METPSQMKRKILLAVIAFQLVIIIVLLKAYGSDVFPTFSPKYSTNLPEVDQAVYHPSEAIDSNFTSYDPSWKAPPSLSLKIDPKTVAVGMGLTTRKVTGLNDQTAHSKLVFFKTLIPSFCRTASEGFRYHFFVAYDYDDPFLNTDSFKSAFNSFFKQDVTTMCPVESTYELHFVKCLHHRSPAWAQNDAMIEAYMMNMAYYFRINDDTAMVTADWTNAFINRLAEFDPPSVGAVGPTHTGGNLAILTYDFVSYKHVEVFGFYYPPVFIDWHGDRWISEVYKPSRVHKLSNIKLNHLMSLGQRYTSHHHKAAEVNDIVKRDKKILLRYLTAMETNEGITASTDKVIAMSLSSEHRDSWYGAVRNAQLMKIFFPTWTLRVYISNHTDYTIPKLIQNKLLTLGVQLREVPSEYASLPTEAWKFLVVADKSVRIFLMHHPMMRFSPRLKTLVNLLENSKSSQCLWCIRDHPSHTEPIIDGLWGGQASCVYDKTDILTGLKSLASVREFLGDLWRKLGDSSLCYDSVTCKKWSNTLPFPFLRMDKSSFIGAMYSAMGPPLNETQLLPGVSPDMCNILSS